MEIRGILLLFAGICRTLEHVESLSSDVSVFARDSTVQRNLKTLVQALGRLLDE